MNVFFLVREYSVKLVAFVSDLRGFKNFGGLLLKQFSVFKCGSPQLLLADSQIRQMEKAGFLPLRQNDFGNRSIFKKIPRILKLCAEIVIFLHKCLAKSCPDFLFISRTPKIYACLLII